MVGVEVIGGIEMGIKRSMCSVIKQQHERKDYSKIYTLTESIKYKSKA